MIAFVLLVGACQQAPTLDAEAGFQGTVFPDAWTRISASIAYQGPPLDVDLRMTVQAFTSEAVVYRKPLRLMGNVRMRTAFDLYVTDYDYAIDVELVEKGKVLSKLSLPLTVIRQETRRLLAVGTPPKVLNDAMAKLPPVTLVRQRAEVFPSTALALRSVDAIFFAEPVELDPDQESALLDWIRRGGRLIFGAPRSTILRHQSFWKELCPLETPDVGTIPLPGTENQSLTLVRGRQRKGRAGSALAGVPLMLRSGEGDGEVVFIPFVLDQPNFAKVVAAAPLLAELLDLPPPPKEEWVPRRGFVRREEWILEERRTRVTESTRDFLRRLLPVEWSLSIGSLASGVGLILVYIVLIGPVEYRRLRQSGRLRSGWRSLAALTVLFGAAVYVWSRHVSPQTSKTTLVTLLDADQVRTFGAIRPGWGDVYQVQSSGLLSLLPPSRAFGAPESFDPMVVTLPSEGRLPIPPSDTRLLASARPPKPGEAGLSATWAGADRNTLLLRNGTDLALGECWAVSKQEVWGLPALEPGTILTWKLEKPIPFNTWASRQAKAPGSRNSWWTDPNPWEGIPEDRVGLVLSFFEAFHQAWNLDRGRHTLQDRSLDLSGGISGGDVVVIGSFDRNLSVLPIQPVLSMRTYGWARTRVREAAK